MVTLDTSPSEPTLSDVSLRQYAAILAARGEGFPLDEALESEGIDPSHWPAAEIAWQRRLGRAAVDDVALMSDFDVRLIEAQDALARRIPPLDEELSAWLDFLRGWSESEEPFALLERFGIRMTDVFRLQRAWSKRLAQDGALQEEAGRILAAPPGELKALSPGARRLKRAMVERHAARAEVREDLRSALVPSLSAPLPRHDEEEVFALNDAGGAVAYSENALPAGEGSMPVPAPTSATPVVSTPSYLRADVVRAVPEPARLSLDQHAMLCAELAAAPARREEIFVRYGLVEQPVRDAVDLAFREQIHASSEVRRAWQSRYESHYAVVISTTQSRRGQHLGSTSPSFEVRLQPAIPFQANSAPNARMAGTGAVPKDPRLSGTSLAVDVPRGPAMPFARGNAPPVSGAEPRVPPKDPRLSGTSLAVDVPRGPAMPFARGNAPPVGGVQPRVPPKDPRLSGTSLAVDVPRGPATPFAPPPNAVAAESTAPRVQTKDPGLAGTSLSLNVPSSAIMPFSAGVPPATSAPAKAPLPRVAPKNASLAGTSLAVDVPKTPALPFPGGTSPVPTASGHDTPPPKK
jgi:hypothetical protein